MAFDRGGRPGLLGTIARTAVISGTAQATSNAVNRRAQARRQREYDAANVPEQAPPPQVHPQPAPAAPAAPAAPGHGASLADQIARLADLHASGALTDEEFAAAKSRLLT